MKLSNETNFTRAPNCTPDEQRVGRDVALTIRKKNRHAKVLKSNEYENRFDRYENFGINDNSQVILYFFFFEKSLLLLKIY